MSEAITLGNRPESAPLEVRRVEDETGTHIEPPLGDWPDIDRIRWNAGVLLVDHGVEIHTTEISPGLFAFHGVYPHGVAWGVSARPFGDAWTFLNGCATGAAMSGTP